MKTSYIETRRKVGYPESRPSHLNDTTRHSIQLINTGLHVNYITCNA